MEWTDNRTEAGAIGGLSASAIGDEKPQADRLRSNATDGGGSRSELRDRRLGSIRAADDHVSPEVTLNLSP
jgi:hypothetical protein